MPENFTILYNQITPYLKLASKLPKQKPPFAIQADVVATLPPVTESSLKQLNLYIEKTAFIHPAESWVAATLMETAARTQNVTPMLQARAAFLLARASNSWDRPDLAAQPLTSAVEIFTKLDEPVWLATCIWQQNALPWTQPNFRQAAQKLNQALSQLEGSFLEGYAPDCRLSLAYAQLLIGQYEQALANIEASEGYYHNQDDDLNVARCWLRRSSLLRRIDKKDEAEDYLTRALTVFQKLSAPVLEAKAIYTLGYVALIQNNDYPTAENYFKKAMQIFSRHDITLWIALCEHAFGEVYMESGQLKKTTRHLDRSRKILASFNIIGALGDVLFDSAKCARLASDHATSVENLQEAIDCYIQVDAPVMVALALMHLGSTYREWGYHQLGLHYLEQAQQQLIDMKHFGRLAECHMRLSHVWLQLNRFKEAEDCLNQAAQYYEENERPAFLITVYGRQAEVAMLTGKSQQAIAQLDKAIALARRYNLDPQIAISQQLLGECLCKADDIEAGLHQLQQAAARFERLGLIFDQSACLVSIGNGQLKQKDTAAAQSAWETALQLNQETVPALIWPARAGLARIAQEAGEHATAINQYQAAISALNRQRRDFWQPYLAGTFLQKAATMLDQAVSLAVNTVDSHSALQFVEAGKAQSVIRRLYRQPVRGNQPLPSSELRTAAAEIQDLYQRIHGQHERPDYRQNSQVNTLIQQLSQKVLDYRQTRSQWERQNLQDFLLTPEAELNIVNFCQTAETRLDGPFVALSYYLTDDSLYITAVIDGNCQCWRRPITAKPWYALEACVRARAKQTTITADQLQLLGDWLLPPEITALLTPDTYLILAPHQRLHHLPWAALTTGDSQQPLVKNCIPVVVPSLTCLSLLWERAAFEPVEKPGLLIGTAEFPGRQKPPLPAIENELDSLAALLGRNGQLLAGKAANWHYLTTIAQENGLSDFSFCHIAGHASFDSLTGRLSGISFYDRDVWLDELWDCSPWPSLVTLAACNSSQSLIHEGDEHIGLSTTLLAAGANTVIGCIWPVLDEAAARLITNFYDHFLGQNRPAKALALAQRQSLNQGLENTLWASFLCTGLP